MNSATLVCHSALPLIVGVDHKTSSGPIDLGKVICIRPRPEHISRPSLQSDLFLTQSSKRLQVPDSIVTNCGVC